MSRSRASELALRNIGDVRQDTRPAARAERWTADSPQTLAITTGRAACISHRVVAA